MQQPERHGRGRHSLVRRHHVLDLNSDWFVILGSGSWPRPIFWVGLIGLITAVISVLAFCAFVFFVAASLANPLFWVPLALMAIVATPVVGSLFTIRKDYHLMVGPVLATVIAAVAVLAFWWVYAQDSSLLYYLAPVCVAASSWVLVPALRPG